MADLTPPAPGQMFLFDNMTPPLLDNSYRMTVETDVAVDGNAQPLPANQSYFNVEGPRFSLASSEVAGVFPPRNGHGPFEETIPHVALSRRTLPWERELDSQNRIGLPGNWQAPIWRGLRFSSQEIRVYYRHRRGVSSIPLKK